VTGSALSNGLLPVTSKEWNGAITPKDTWYISFELPSDPASWDRRPYSRNTSTFRSEIDAKNFAKARLSDSRSVNAGTLNPYLPKRVITSTQIYEWVEDPVDQKTVEDANQYK
jgi:hypothetical protein